MKKTYRIENDNVILGVVLPVFVYRGDYYLDELYVYEDGKIRDAWGFISFKSKEVVREKSKKSLKNSDAFRAFLKSENLKTIISENVEDQGDIKSQEDFDDFEELKEKIIAGEVLTSIPKGEKIFLPDIYGHIETIDFQPNKTGSELVKEVEAIIGRFQHEKIVAYPNVNSFEFFPSFISKNNVCRIENGRIIRGIPITVFIHNQDYFLGQIHVYEDGKIGDGSALIDLEGFKEKMSTGTIKNSIGKGRKNIISPLGQIESIDSYLERTDKDIITDVEDIINQFQGKKSFSASCDEAFQVFLKSPNKKNRELLKVAYELVKENEQPFILGDMDVDDFPIRACIYGDIVFTEHWKAQMQEKYIREGYLAGIEIFKTASDKK